MAKKKARKRTEPAAMPTVHPHAAGIDLGSTEHYVAVPPRPDGAANVRTFSTTTRELHVLADWLLAEGIQTVAMESTGIYWIPVFEILEDRGLEVVLVNARHLKGVPGRKTDMIDCQWIQLLHACGLLRGSFRPEASMARLRVLWRQHANLVESRVQAVHWMQKSLDQMNILVHRAVSNIVGATGLRIVRAIVDGERDPLALAAQRDRGCKKSAEQIAEYLTGTWHDEHLFNLKMALQHYDHLCAQITEYEEYLVAEMKKLQPPERAHQSVPKHPNKSKERAMRSRGEQTLREEIWRLLGVDLTTIDGISPLAALIIVTEIGCNVSAFPSEKHFISWLRLAPRLAISGGKPIRKKANGTGANRVAGVLRLAAMSLSRSRTALGAESRRIAFRKGGKVAIFALARKLATLVYRLLRYGQQYVDAGERTYEARFEARRLKSLQASAKHLGFTLVPTENAA
jgi:transposase